MAKVTFTLDDETVQQLRKIAARTRKPRSLIVREAIAHYAATPPDVRISPEERDRKLRILREMTAQPPTRTSEDVDAELRELRESRRGPHRLHPVD